MHALSDDRAQPRRERGRLGLPALGHETVAPVDQHELDGRGRLRGRERRGRDERPVGALVEEPAEELVDERQHRSARAEVSRQRARSRSPVTAGPEEPHVGVAKAVDRLELVADEDTVARLRRDQIEQPALQAVRVLKLIDEHEVVGRLHLGSHARIGLEQLAEALLQVIEVERALALLGALVGRTEARQELLQPLVRRAVEVLEGDTLERLARLLQRTQRPSEEPSQVRQLGRCRLACEQRPQALEPLARLLARHRARKHRVAGSPQRGDGLAQRAGARGNGRRALATRPELAIELEHELAQLGEAVVGQELEGRLGIVAARELDGSRERGACEHPRLPLVEHAQVGRQPCGERVLAQQPGAEAVDRRGVHARARRLHARRGGWKRAGQPIDELARRGLRVGHDEHALGSGSVRDRPRDPRDHDGGLAGARTCREKELAVGERRRSLLGGQLERAHARSTRQIGPIAHQAGQAPRSPSDGSCRTSPRRIRSTARRAAATASSSTCSNRSSAR